MLKAVNLVKNCVYHSPTSLPSFCFFRSMSSTKVEAVLIDLSGTLHVEDQPTPNSIEALKRLRALDVHVKFVTNTTKESISSLYNRLIKIGFSLEKEEIYGSLKAASNYVVDHKLNPFYILTDDARTDFPENNQDTPFDAVVVGLAPEKFDYAHVNKAFQILHQNGSAKLIAIHEGKFYKTKSGIDVGPGCFIKGLEYAANVKAICIGKPTEHFFRSALPGGLKPENAVMIGDDPIDDCLGAMKIGMKGFLVETGKYQPSQYTGKALPATSGIFNSFADVVDHLIELKSQ